MRIVCPSCSAAYDVPDSLVTAGRVVRCARCGGDWTPVEAPAAAEIEVQPEATMPPPEADPAIIDAPPPAPRPPRPSAMDRLAAHPAWPQSRLRLRLAWIASLVLLAMLGWSAYAWRGQIVEAWPPSARLYAAFGLHPTR